jgi:hypothetical protein
MISDEYQVPQHTRLGCSLKGQESLFAEGNARIV